MRFRQAKQNRIFQDIVEQVEDAIVSGELAPGEKLPPERDMCAMFKTSRGTLREALRILEQKRLITIRLGAGGGAVVRQTNSDLIRENFLLLVRAGRIAPSHLIQVTAELAAALATTAAKQASQEDVEPLKKLVVSLSRLLEEEQAGPEVCLKMDALLFSELTKTARNPLYGYLLEAAFKSLDSLPLRQRGEDRDAATQKHYQEIRMIVYAVAQHDAAHAARLSREHLAALFTP